MFTHFVLGSNDIRRSRMFYDATIAALGHEVSAAPDLQRLIYANNEGTLIIGTPANGEPASAANGATLGFAAKRDADVDAWHAAGMANGGANEGEPGNRIYSPGNSYGAYLRDPDGNKLCCFNLR